MASRKLRHSFVGIPLEPEQPDMTIGMPYRRTLAILALLFGVTACTDESSTAMTPEQSRQTLINEAKAIIQAVLPGTEPRVVVQTKDAPCGGAVGTDHSSVESLINVHSDAVDKSLTSEAVFNKVVGVLKQRGWTINYTQNYVAGAKRKGFGGISAGVGDSPVGINISGDTECVTNPDA
ncbi:hypothetical protein ACGFIV_01940 [Sphaerisporangium sp. NPDC049003]|uniref:hypothetical protein n=1 Tax=Sphaerisporangium sp. NPDC049003 TaxID=3364517 RepID=UPI00371E34E5